MTRLLADQPLGNITGIGPLGTNLGSPATTIGEMLSNIVGLLTIIGLLWFVFQIVTAGLEWISSSGEKANVANVREKIFHAVAGLIVIISAIFIIYLIAALLGLGNALNLGTIINSITPH